MEFCPGGDLHSLRQRQPGKHFGEQAVKFYVAEVLLAMEYLHMLGIVYRDMKPENVLVREDGHIMLSDFDLSLRCTVSPSLVKSSAADLETSQKKIKFIVSNLLASSLHASSQLVWLRPLASHPASFPASRRKIGRTGSRLETRSSPCWIWLPSQLMLVQCCLSGPTSTSLLR